MENIAGQCAVLVREGQVPDPHRSLSPLLGRPPMSEATPCFSETLRPFGMESNREGTRGGHLADIKLFQLQADSVRELPAESVDIEKTLQLLLERHLEQFLGVRFIATEYQTGKTHAGRVDTLGLDDNN